MLLAGSLMACGVALHLHLGSIWSLKRENSLLKEKLLTVSATETEAPKNLVPAPESPSVELLRLRSEVRQLREQTAQVATLRRGQLELHMTP